MKRLHEHIIKKSRWYDVWHSFRWYQLVHWSGFLLLSLVMGITFGLLLQQSNIKVKTSLAATFQYPPYTPPAGSPLALREHPRMFFTAAELPALRQRIATYYLTEFNQYLDALDTSFTDNISTKAENMLYFDARNYGFLCSLDPALVSGASPNYSRQEYCNKAIEHVLAIDSDTSDGKICADEFHLMYNFYPYGGCPLAASLVYDWTYQDATTAQRQSMAAILQEMYDVSIAADTDLVSPYNTNIDLLGNGLHMAYPVILPPLAMWGDPEVPNQQQLDNMLSHMNDFLLVRIVDKVNHIVGPDADGRYDNWHSGAHEGPGYSFDTFSNYMYLLSAASSALGNNYFYTSTFTRYVPLFYYYKMLPFAMHGYYHYARHDTGNIDQVRYEVGCNDKCISVMQRIFRMWAYQLKNDDSTLAGVAAWMVTQSPFAVDPQDYAYGGDIRTRGLFSYFLGGERGITPLSPAQANLPLFFRNGDWTVFKSNHNLETATFLEIDAPNWYWVGGHNGFEPTSLQLSKYGTLFVRNGAYKNGHCPRWKNPNSVRGSMTGPYTDNQMSLGLPSVKTKDQANGSMITEDGPNDIGDVTIFDSFSGVDVFGYDYTKMYQRNLIVSNARQHLVYLRGGENNEFFIEHNHIDSNYENLKLLHTPADVQVIDGTWKQVSDHEWRTTSAKIYSVTNNYNSSHGKVYITSVYPTSKSAIKYGGSGYEWLYADGTKVPGRNVPVLPPLDDYCATYSGKYTLQFKTNEQDLVTVYQPGDSNTLNTAETASAVLASGMKGTKIKNNIVLFNTNPQTPLASTGYTVNTTGSSQHILVGFAPYNSYQIDINGSVQNITASKGGVLYFNDSGNGSRTVSIGGGTPPQSDIEPPSVPTGLATEAKTSSSIKLKWNASVDNLGVAGYRIYRNNTAVGTSPSLSFADSGLTADTSYQYAVSAYDAAGNESAKSAVLNVQTLAPSDTTLPIANSFEITPLSTTADFTVSWNVSDNNQLAKVEVWRAPDTNGQQGEWTLVYSANISGQSDTGSTTDSPAPGTYWYGLHVIDQSGNTGLEPNPPGPIKVTKTSSSQGNLITLDKTKSYQTINGWEAVAWMAHLDNDYQLNNYTKWKNIVLDKVVNEAGINRLSVEVRSGIENPVDYFTSYLNGQISRAEWKQHWYEPINDNNDPQKINTSGFQFSELDFAFDNIVIPLRQKLQANGEALYLNLNYVDFLGSSFEHFNNPDEYAELMLAIFQHLDNKYGFVPNAIEVILEPDLANGWSPSDIAAVVATTGSRLQANGYQPDFIAPSTTKMDNASSYFDQITSSAAAKKYIKELSYHRYGGVSSAALNDIAQRAKANSIRSSMLEWWNSANSYKTLHEDLKIGRNSSWQQGALADIGAPTNLYVINTSNPDSPQVEIGSMTKFTRQYFKYIRAGAVRIAAVSENTAYDPLAFINKDGGYTVVVKADQGGDFSVSNLPAGKYSITYATASEWGQALPDVSISNGQILNTSIPAPGVLTIYEKQSVAPPTGGSKSFKFVALGDTRGEYMHAENVKGILKRVPNAERDLIIDTGDLRYEGAESEWQDWQAAVAPLQLDWTKTPPPYIAALGNHEVQKPGWLQRFNNYLPGQVKYGQDGLWGSVTHKGVHFIWLVTFFDWEHYGLTWESTLTEADQDAWLEQDLIQAAQDPEVNWIVAFYHVPVVSCGSGGTHQKAREWQNGLFQQYGVDLTFEGHNHYYVRSCPLIYKGDDYTPSQCDENNRGNVMVNPNGTVHIITGGGGAPLKDVLCTSQPCSACPFLESGARSWHFIEVDVNDKVLTGKVWDVGTWENTAGDNPTIIDQFTISKEAKTCSNNNDCSPSYQCLNNICLPDKTPPVVAGFDVQPRTTDSDVTITWDVSDNNKLATVEIWRAPDANGGPGKWSLIHSVDTNSLTNGGTITDIMPTGEFWYGLHAIDAAGNTGYEPFPPGPIKVTKIDNQPRISLVKSADLTEVQSGDVITYTITYTNTSNYDAHNARLSDNIPVRTTFVPGSATAAGTYDSNNNILQWTIPTIAKGTSGFVTFKVKVD